MPSLNYRLYCDETGINKGPTFHLGGIHCTRARAAILEKQIAAFRERTNCRREMKWSKVSKRYLPKYMEFADIFLDDPHATFVLAEIQRDERYRDLASSDGNCFLQTYFRFLEEAMWASARYAIYLDDDETVPRYKWRSMHYAMNIPTLKRQKKITAFVPVKSKQHDLAQLVDVILGAMTSTEATADHKLELQNYVDSRIDKETKYGHSKLRTLDWTHIANRRFGPKI